MTLETPLNLKHMASIEKLQSNYHFLQSLEAIRASKRSDYRELNLGNQRIASALDGE